MYTKMACEYETLEGLGPGDLLKYVTRPDEFVPHSRRRGWKRESESDEDEAEPRKAADPVATRSIEKPAAPRGPAPTIEKGVLKPAPAQPQSPRGGGSAVTIAYEPPRGSSSAR